VRVRVEKIQMRYEHEKKNLESPVGSWGIHGIEIGGRAGVCVCEDARAPPEPTRAHRRQRTRCFQKRRAASLRTCRCIMSLITSRPAAPLKAGSRAGRLLVEPPTLASCPPHPTGGGWPLIDTLPSSGYRLDDDLGHKSRRAREKKNESGRDLLSSKMGGGRILLQTEFSPFFWSSRP
jgi:hypothetical protein